MSALVTAEHTPVGADAEIEPPVTNSARPNSDHPSHPHYILEHLVRNVLPAKCRNDKVIAYYKSQLDDAQQTIDLCRSKLAGWVLDLWEKGSLYKYPQLKKHAVTKFPDHGVVYLGIYKIEDKDWRYAGQTNHGHRRIVKEHGSASHRKLHPKFAYFLHDQAEETLWLLPVPDLGMMTGPIYNILEQWISLIFRTLQPSELKDNLDVQTLSWIPALEMHKGANIREPLGQGFGFAEFPKCSTSLKYSPVSLKREWYQIHHNRDVVVRQKAFLEGELFQGSFWNAPGWYGKADYEFQIWSVKFRIGKSWIDRCDEDTIRIWCDLRPEGEIHPQNIVRGHYSRAEYNDPARRLGIKVSGTRKGDLETGWCWVMMDGGADKSIPRVNRLVDWLLDLDTEELRPRRYYPANHRLGRPRCGYTRHPIDVGEAWRVLVEGESS